MQKSIVTKLSKYLMDRGIKRKQVAEACGISIHRVQRIAAGFYPPTAEEKAAIAEVLQVPVGELFNPWDHLSEEDQVIESLCAWLRTPSGKLVVRQVRSALCL